MKNRDNNRIGEFITIAVVIAVLLVFQSIIHSQLDKGAGADAGMSELESRVSVLESKIAYIDSTGIEDDTAVVVKSNSDVIEEDKVIVAPAKEVVIKESDIKSILVANGIIAESDDFKLEQEGFKTIDFDMSISDSELAASKEGEAFPDDFLEAYTELFDIYKDILFIYDGEVYTVTELGTLFTVDNRKSTESSSSLSIVHKVTVLNNLTKESAEVVTQTIIDTNNTENTDDAVQTISYNNLLEVYGRAINELSPEHAIKVPSELDSQFLVHTSYERLFDKYYMISSDNGNEFIREVKQFGNVIIMND